MDKKTSDLTPGAPAVGTDLVSVARSGDNYSLTLNDVIALVPPSSGGGITHRVRAFDNAGAITVNNNTPTKLTGLDNNTEDTDGFTDNFGSDDSAIVIPAGLGGMYLVGAYVDWDTNTTGSRSIKVVNTTLGATIASSTDSAAFGEDSSASGYYYLSAGDNISVYVQQNSGSSRTCRIAALWALKID